MESCQQRLLGQQSIHNRQWYTQMFIRWSMFTSSCFCVGSSSIYITLSVQFYRLAARASRSPHLLNMCRLTTCEHIKEKQFSHNILVGFTDTVCIVWDIFASFNVLNVFCCPHATVNRGWSFTNQTFNLPSTAGISYFHY